MPIMSDATDTRPSFAPSTLRGSRGRVCVSAAVSRRCARARRPLPPDCHRGNRPPGARPARRRPPPLTWRAARERGGCSDHAHRPAGVGVGLGVGVGVGWGAAGRERASVTRGFLPVRARRRRRGARPDAARRRAPAAAPARRPRRAQQCGGPRRRALGARAAAAARAPRRRAAAPRPAAARPAGAPADAPGDAVTTHAVLLRLHQRLLLLRVRGGSHRCCSPFVGG
jgi:hypothetical protein